jgi:hypothetical protein
MERQSLVNGNEELQVIARTALDKNAKLKHGNEILLKQRKQLILVNMKSSADQRAC